jgi:hypothetical protein
VKGRNGILAPFLLEQDIVDNLTQLFLPNPFGENGLGHAQKKIKN